MENDDQARSLAAHVDAQIDALHTAIAAITRTHLNASELLRRFD